MKLMILAFTCFMALNACTAAVPTPPTTEKPINNGSTENTYATEKKALLTAKNIWEKQSKEHYIYTLERSCFCPPESRKPMRIRVKDAKIVQVLLVPENIEKPTTYSGALSVEGLFELIQTSIDQKAASIDVKYDKQYGYPTSISIDRDKRIADEEVYYKASGMRLL